MLSFFIFLLAIVSLSMLEEHNMQKRILTLESLKKNIDKIHDLDFNDDTLAAINFQSTKTDIVHQLRAYEKSFDGLRFITLFIDRNDADSLGKLRTQIESFFDESERRVKRSPQASKKDFDAAYITLLKTIHARLDAHIAVMETQFSIREAILFFVVVVGLIVLFVTHRRFKFVLTDIESLYGIGLQGDSSYKIQTIEVETVASRLRKHTGVIEQNPAFMDPVAEIKNYRGMVHAFNTNKFMKNSDSVAVCLFDIDHFDILKRKYNDEFVRAVLKKIAFILDLNAHASDIVATFEESKFVFILSRASKNIALDDCQKVRESVASTIFKSPQGEKLRITLSGAFLIKLPAKTIESSVTDAVELLKEAQNSGTNHIVEIKDYAARV